MVRRGERGIALPLVLWTILLLALLAAGVNSDSREALAASRQAAAVARAEALADAGIIHAMRLILDPQRDGIWQADGRPLILDFAGGSITIRIQDTAGLVDLNTGDDDLLHGLLSQNMEPSAAQSLTRAIAARRSEQPFNDVTELRLVTALPTDLVRRLEPLLTVHGGMRGVDPVVAPPEVLAALPDTDPRRIEELLAARQAGEPLPALSGTLLATSPRRVFQVTTEARVAGATYRRLAVLRPVRIGDRPFVVHVWRNWSPV